MQPPLTEQQLDGIRQTLAHFQDVQDGNPPTGPRATYLADVPALLNEIERLADQISACWLALDEITRRGHHDDAHKAAQLLRSQQAPGWKGKSA